MKKRWLRLFYCCWVTNTASAETLDNAFYAAEDYQPAQNPDEEQLGADEAQMGSTRTMFYITKVITLSLICRLPRFFNEFAFRG